MKLQIIIAICIFALANTSTNPTPPLWANQWQSNFIHETHDGIFGNGTTTGTMYYDWTNKLYRIDRATGKRDKYCGSVKKLKDTPCSHLVIGDTRYIYYPELNFCCKCCSVQDGCGMLKPTWLQNATYDGQTTLNKTSVDGWSVKGIQTNYYYELPETRIPMEIYMSPTDKFDFDASTYRASIVDPNIFNLPSICKQSQACTRISACGVVGIQSQLSKARNFFGF